MKNWSIVILGIALIVCAAIAAGAYKYKYRAQETVVVTGLGEQEFTSDRIVWRGFINTQNLSVEAGYRELEKSKNKVQDYLRSQGITDSAVVFLFVNVMKETEPVYSNGNYVGHRFTGYALQQGFTVESRDVEAVENVSREISALIAQGVQIESWAPEYYYTRLGDVKMRLIETATADARARAERIAAESGSRLGRLRGSRLGVFQITGANTNEEFSAGGSFNTLDKNKKARVTVRLEYILR